MMDDPLAPHLFHRDARPGGAEAAREAIAGRINRLVEKGRLGAATVSLKVPFVGHPSDAQMQEAIQQALAEVGGVRSVKVDVREMTDSEQAEAMGKVTAKVPGVVAPGSQTRVISI